MIGYLKGEIIDTDVNKLVVSVGGVGYLVNVSAVLLYEHKQGDTIELFIQPEIREDAFELFGFKTKDEKVFYKKIRSVNGVGPKTAINIMNIPVVEIIVAIEEENIKKLCTTPGLGKKTAERLILELKGNLPKRDSDAKPTTKFSQEIIHALENFGYREKEILSILETMPSEITSPQEVIKFFLTNI